jgi:hypothetical protein
LVFQQNRREADAEEAAKFSHAASAVRTIATIRDGVIFGDNRVEGIINGKKRLCRKAVLRVS